MVNWVNDWLFYLRDSSGLIGFPLALGGVVLMAGGWRIWKVAVILTFGIIGAVIGTMLAKGGPDSMFYATIGFLVLGGASYPPANYSIVLIGGIIGAGIFNFAFAGFGLAPGALWAITGIGLIASCAIAFLNLRQVIAVVTAFQGAVLMLSAAVAFVAEVPGLYNYFRAMAHKGSIVLPFLLLVPTVVGTLIQLADVNRRGAAIGRG
ncbi:MAG: hypothetical protein ACYSUQ_10150 [Planctomycetota bacterium]